MQLAQRVFFFSKPCFKYKCFKTIKAYKLTFEQSQANPEVALLTAFTMRPSLNNNKNANSNKMDYRTQVSKF